MKRKVMNIALKILLAFMLLAGVSLVVLICIVSPLWGAYDALVEPKKEIKESSEKLTFYVDGVKVGLEEIDLDYFLENYHVTYDQENGKVIFTK